MSEDPTGGAGAPSEEELRAAYEAELGRLRVEQLLIEHVVTMVNLGMRRTGLAPGTEEERDPEQVRLAIESIRALMPLLDEAAPQQAAQIRPALSQLQLAFVRLGGQAPASPGATGGPAAGAAGAGAPDRDVPPEPAGTRSDGSDPETSQPGEPGPAQRSGRLWVPGQ